MNKLKTWLGRQRPSYRIYFLIVVACIALHVPTLFCFFALLGYDVLESLDEWIIRRRRDEAHDVVMDIFHPDPEGVTTPNVQNRTLATAQLDADLQFACRRPARNSRQQLG